MKFKTINKDLLKSLNYMSKIAVKNNINPIFECVFIKVEDHNLILRATNLEIIIEKSINIKGILNGQVLIKVGILQKILQNIDPSDTLDIELEGNILKIISNKNEFEFEILSASEDLPNVPDGVEELFNIKSYNFSNNIKSVIFCASKSDIKPEISSVYVYKKDDAMYYVSTDSYRLAEKIEYVENNKQFSLILPYKNLINILSIIDDMDEELSFISYNDGLIIKGSDISIAMRVVNGNYPDYKQLFPREFNFKINVKREEIQKALQISNILTSQYNFCEFKLDSDKEELILKSKEKGIGNSKSVVKYEKLEGEIEDFDINYNSVYFYEGIQKISSNNITFSYTVPNKPLFIKSEDNNSFTYLLMPLNR